MDLKVLAVAFLVLVIVILLLVVVKGGSRVVRDVYYVGVEDGYRALDIYTLSTRGKHPVIFFVHGGAWTMGDKGNHAAKALFFVRKGYVFVGVNYRLAPDVKYPAFAYDVAQALAWVYNHIEEYGGDRDKIYLMGHSAGAHLVALISYDAEFLGRYGLNTTIIKGLILLDGGGYDTPYVREEFPLLFKMIYEQAFGDDEETLRDASPIYHLKKGMYVPPTLVIYTSWKHTYAEAQRLMDALRRVGASYDYYYAEDKTHDAVSRDIGKPGDKVTEKILDYLDKLNSE